MTGSTMIMNSKFNYQKKIEDLTKLQMTEEDAYKILAHMMEEVGEFCEAMCIEDGGVGKDYKEPPEESSTEEAVDIVVCALSLFYARGGTKEQFLSVIEKKLGKWEKNQAKSLGK